jgi:hypothetical protein
MPTKRTTRAKRPAAKSNLQTTLRLPDSLYQKARKLVVEEKHAASMNDLIIAALSAYLRALDRKLIDSAFAAMTNDSDYQNEAALISREFASSDAEAAARADRQFADRR